MSDAAGVPILRFRAGTLPCAVAARDVAALRDPSGDRPALWRLLGLRDGAAGAGEASRAWGLRLAHGDVVAEVVVQGPIEITELMARDVLPRPEGLAVRDGDLVIGFARCAREVVLLLDIPTLVALAS